MKLRHVLFSGITMLFLSTLLTPPLRAVTVEQVVEKANHMAYYQGVDGKSKVNMVITDEQGRQRNREFIILRKDESPDKDGDQKYFVYFQAPADVRKMVFMVHKHTAEGADDDRWLYLPNLDLVKRIAASDKRTSFVGSDYLYEDVSGRGLDADTHEIIRSNEKHYVVKNTPKKPDMVEFSHYLVYVDQKTFIPMKMEYFDKSGALYRTIEAVTVKDIEAERDGETVVYPTVTESVVKDLKNGSTTTMTFSDIDYNIGLEDDIFTERYLRRPPREAIR